jgi:hypothetical protein
MISRTRTTILVCNIVLLAALIVIAQSQHSAVGTWKLNVQKSDFGSVPAPKSMTIVVTEDSKNKVAWKANGVGPDGKKINESYSGSVDGNANPVKGSPTGEQTVAYTRNADGTVTAVTKDKNGQEVAHGTISWSDDGKTMTLKNTRKSPGGDLTYSEVYDKVK